MTPRPVTTTRCPYIRSPGRAWPKNDGRVVTAQPEAVGKRRGRSPLPRFVRHVVQVALRVRRLVVDGRRQPACLNRLDTRQALEGARRSEHMPGHALG